MVAMRVLALTFGDTLQASSRYRVFQYIEPLRREGIVLETTRAKSFADWEALLAYDAVILQKSLLSVAKVRRLRQRCRRLVYDVDDAIWHAHGKQHFWLTNWRTRLRLKAVASRVDLCTVANNVLSTGLSAWAKRVIVVPMALDEQQWPFPGERGASERVRIGWAGHPVNLPYLEAIAPALQRLQQTHPEVDIIVFCGSRPRLDQVHFQHLPYQPDTEAAVIRSFDLGLLPLPGNDFAAGKSPIKGLQYMACGVPTIASPLGATAEMFKDGETGLFANTLEQWTEALSQLVRQPEWRTRMGRAARCAFETHYALGQTARLLADVLKSLLRSGSGSR